MSITSAYEKLIEGIGGKVRAIGFNPKGKIFRMFIEGNAAIIDFQKSDKSSAEKIIWLFRF